MKFICFRYFITFLLGTTTLAYCNTSLNIDDNQREQLKIESSDNGINQSPSDDSINQHILCEDLKKQLLLVQEDLAAIDYLNRNKNNINNIRKKLETKKVFLLNQLQAIEKNTSIKYLTEWQKLALAGGGLVLICALTVIIISKTKTPKTT